MAAMADLAARTERALSAAVAAGRDLGLPATGPKILHDAFSVIVHLVPAPVVVRVPTVLPPTFGLPALARRQCDEAWRGMQFAGGLG
jgi:hypothetical protein